MGRQSIVGPLSQDYGNIILENVNHKVGRFYLISRDGLDTPI